MLIHGMDLHCWFLIHSARNSKMVCPCVQKVGVGLNLEENEIIGKYKTKRNTKNLLFDGGIDSKGNGQKEHKQPFSFVKRYSTIENVYLIGQIVF